MDPIVGWIDRYHINPAAILATVVLLIGATIGIVLANRLLRHWLGQMQARLHLNYETVTTATRVIGALLWIVTAILVLNIWGVDIGGLWALLASVATVIGVGFLATWAMVSNCTANVFLTMWHPFRLGQTVEVLPENLKGRVIDRNMMFTTLREESGAVIAVPNNVFFQKMFRVVDAGERSSFELLEIGNGSIRARPQEAADAAAPLTAGQGIGQR